MEKKSTGLVKTGLVLGIISLVLTLLPAVSAWFVFLTWLIWLTATAGLICGIIALVKKHEVAKTNYIALACNFLAYVLYFVVPSMVVSSAASSAANAFQSFM